MAERKIKDLLDAAPFTSQWHSRSSARELQWLQAAKRQGDWRLFTNSSTAVLGGNRRSCRQAIYTKGHTCMNIPNVIGRNKNASWTHHHLILDKLNCLNRGSTKKMMFQWIFVYQHHLMPCDVATVTGENTQLQAFHVKWVQLMMSLC